MDPRVVEKFWNCVEKTSFCWNWTGFLDKKGGPVIRMSNGIKNGKVSLKEYSPRRISLLLIGAELNPKLQVQPWCKNRFCVNPDHLGHGDEARFWNKVQKLKEEDGGCWVWTAGQDKDMYGKFSYWNKDKLQFIRAHIYSWFLYSGRVPPEGVQVCHKCDHPYCVNPDHLFLGTTQDNTKDRDDKNRQCKGEASPHAKLTEEKVKEIRELFATGNYTRQQLSDLFKVSTSTMSYIILRKTWKHIA
jgi:hypothetical protein